MSVAFDGSCHAQGCRLRSASTNWNPGCYRIALGCRCIVRRRCSFPTRFRADILLERPSGAGQYRWGQDGFLKLDGSRGRIVCSHTLRDPFLDRSTSLALEALFAAGRRYEIRLYDTNDRVAALMQIRGDGSLAAVGQNHREKYPSLNIRMGIDAAARSLSARNSASPLHWFRFGSFDFSGGSFGFQLDRRPFESVPLFQRVKKIGRIELRSSDPAPGSIIWVRRLTVSDGRDEVEDERFEGDWVPNVPVRRGYPADKWRSTSYRPVADGWMQMTTRYGAVYTRFSEAAIPKGLTLFDVDDRRAGWRDTGYFRPISRG